MEKKIRKMLVLGTVLALIAMTFAVVPMSVSAAELHVGPGQPYPTIQSAINAANPGDTIIVHPSTYNENVIVNKQLTLHGYGTASTTINGGGVGNVVRITANGVIMFGFKVQNSGNSPGDAGIELYQVDNCLINDTYCTSNCDGSFLNQSTYNTITDNTCISNTGEGIRLYYYSNNNNITYNSANSNKRGIILEYRCDHNNIIGNTANSNWKYHGINLHEECYHNLIANNTCKNNYDEGIHLRYKCDLNLLYNNTIESNEHGIIVWDDSDNNIITNNTVRSNDVDGINLMYTSDYNIIKNNHIISNGYTGNSYGIFIYGVYIPEVFDFRCNNNEIYHNNISNNYQQAYDNGNNFWDNGYPCGGNYWDDFDEPGEGAYDDFRGPAQTRSIGLIGDGIVDLGWPGGGLNPYNIPGGINADTYPLIKQVINDRVQRPPIRINSNIDFDDAHGVVSGSGTQDDPWIIEGWHIDGTNFGYCIYVGNTTDYFIIRDCYVYDASGSLPGDWPYYNDAGITFYYVTNGKITSYDWNIGDPHAMGIGFIIIKPTIAIANWFGILLIDSCSNTMSNSIANENGYGIILFSEWSQSINNMISNNICNNNDADGIHLVSNMMNNAYNTILGNICNFNGDIGINLEYFCHDILIENNECVDNDIGVRIHEGWDNDVINNFISSNNYVGIFLLGGLEEICYNNLIIDNMISYNTGYGIEIEGCCCDGNRIYHNNFLFNNGATTIYNPANVQAYDNSGFSPTPNQWDNGYPSGGNHWCDWTTPDLFSGPNQDQPGSDGIVDNPYIIPGPVLHQDNYPFVNPL